MALYKIGKSYYNNEERPICLLQGNAVRDAENKPVKGKDHGKVTVAAQTNAAGDTMFVTVNGWRDRAAEVMSIQKMDSVLAVGVLKTREYNGAKYYDLDADFICISGTNLGATPYAPRSRDTGTTGEFEEIDDPDEDGELPF